jgi:hypothetical protein
LCILGARWRLFDQRRYILFVSIKSWISQADSRVGEIKPIREGVENASTYGREGYLTSYSYSYDIKFDTIEMQPSRKTFSTLIEQLKDKDLDAAFKLFKASSGFGVRTTTLEATILGRKLAALGRWAGISRLLYLIIANPS